MGPDVLRRVPFDAPDVGRCRDGCRGGGKVSVGVGGGVGGGRWICREDVDDVGTVEKDPEYVFGYADEFFAP